jgi:hypothetical protein
MKIDLTDADVENAALLAAFFIFEVHDMVNCGEPVDDIMVALTRAIAEAMEIREAARSRLN